MKKFVNNKSGVKRKGIISRKRKLKIRRRRKRSLINRYDFAFVFLMSDECGSVPGRSSMKKEIDW